MPMKLFPGGHRDPVIGIFTTDVMRLVEFYETLGFQETFRTPKEGTPAHVEVSLDELTIGISSVAAAIADHGLSPSLGGRPIEIILWADDVDAAYDHLTANGARSLSPPHTFLGTLRAAWIADPDGNPIHLAQRH